MYSNQFIQQRLLLRSREINFCCIIISSYIGTVVGLERTFYIVSEDEGAVEVCAVVITPAISCQREFPFTVTFSATSTGKSISVSVCTLL